jgi:hypothetical protein
VGPIVVLSLIVGAVWIVVASVRGEEADQGPVLAKPVNQAPPAESAAPPAKTAPPAKKPAPPPSKAAAPGEKEPIVTPPEPLPDVEIPPIPEVKDDPFKPGPRPIRPRPADVIEEGKRLFSREGRLEMDPIGRSMFVFDSGDKPVWLLESTWREYLEKVTDQGKKKAHWRVSGIVTIYGGRNYLLLTKVVQMSGPEEGL